MRQRLLSLGIWGTTTAGLALFAGCLEPPDISKAAAPDEATQSAPIMGGSTNVELKKKEEILVGLLDGKLDAKDIQKKLDKEFKDLDQGELERRLKAIKDALAGLDVQKGKPVRAGPERDMVMARFYFTERRFIEAGEHLSKILDADPEHPEARNLLARCFYFLGNPDRTLEELELRISQLDKKRATSGWDDRDAYEYVDALFLIGAAVLESPGTSRENLERGQRAWTKYLELAPNSEAAEKVKNGLVEIEAGLRGEGRLAQAQQVRAAAAMGQGQGVKGGAASFGGGGMGPAAKEADRVKNLPADASPFDRAMAELLDALDTRDPAGAQTALGKAKSIKPEDPDVLTSEARLKVQVGSIPEALELYGQIIKRYPDHMPAWHYMGMAHMMGGDPGQAAKTWEHIQQKDPAYFNQANLARRVEVAKRMAQGR